MTKKVYRQRAKLKRWKKEIEAFEAERVEKLEEIKADGQALSGSLEYVEGRLKTLREQVEEIKRLDLRTDEEKRGTHRKEYTRTKDIEDRGQTEADIRNRRRRLKRNYPSIYGREQTPVATPVPILDYDEEQREAWKNLQRRLKPHIRYRRPEVDPEAGPGARGAYHTEEGHEILSHWFKVELPAIHAKYPNLEYAARDFGNPDHRDFITDEWLAEYQETQRRISSTSVRDRMKAARRKLKAAKTTLERIEAGQGGIHSDVKAAERPQADRRGRGRRGTAD